MLVICRVLNNNSFVTVDKNGTEVVLIGKGIGFGKKKGQKVSVRDVSHCQMYYLYESIGE